MKNRLCAVLALSLIVLSGCSGNGTNDLETIHEDLVEVANGVVDFQQDDLSIYLDLNGADRALFAEDPGSMLGRVVEMLLSPNQEFLAITTGQGGGYGISIYDIPNNTVYALGSFSSDTEWFSDNRLRIVDYEIFGENIGSVTAIYESTSNKSPWELVEVEK